MSKCIYGVDPSKKVTPIMVRNAIIRCFQNAHKEVLEDMNKNKEFNTDQERKNFERIQVDLIVRDMFDEVGDDFENPTKEGITKVLDKLAAFASRYRKPKIIKRHYNEIMRLVNRMQ
jgi:hypothetical protein